MRYFYIGLGGMVGSVLRYGIGIWSINWMGGTVYPIGTLVINLIGAFLLSFLTASVFKMYPVHSYVISAVGTGLIGSFTTFSTFTIETVTMVNNGLFVQAFLYVIISLFAGLLFAAGGFWLGNGFIESRGD